jgi:hypothetical protein
MIPRVLRPAFVWAAALAAVAASAEAAAPAKPGWLSRLPADTWYLAGMDLGGAATQEFAATPLGRILAEPAAVRYRTEAVDPLLAQAAKALSAQIPGPVAESAAALLKSAGTGRATVAVLGVRQDGPGKPPAPQIVLAVEPGAGEAAAFRQAFGNIEPMLLAALGEKGPKVEPRKLPEAEVRTVRLPTPGGELPVSWGFLGDALLITAGADAEDVVWSAKKPAMTLYEDNDFREFGRAVRAGVPMATVWLNIAAVRQFAEKNLPPQAAEVFAAFGVSDVRVLAEGSFIRDGAFRTVTRLKTAKPVGILTAFAGNPMDASDLRLIPKSARHFVSFPFDPAVLYDAVMSGIKQAAPPQEFERLEQQLRELAEDIGLDLRKDLLAALGGRVTLVGHPTDTFPVIGGATAVITLKDPAKAKAAAAKFRDSLKQFLRNEGRIPLEAGLRFHVQLNTREFRSHVIESVNVGLIAPAWTLTDKHLIVGVTPQAVMDYLLYLDDKTAPSIAENADFAARIKAVGGLGEKVAYTDLPAWWPDVHSSLLIGLYSAELGLNAALAREGVQTSLRPELFPGIAAVQPHLTGIVFSGGWKDGVYRMDSVSPLPLPPPTMAIAEALVLTGLTGYLTYAEAGPALQPRPRFEDRKAFPKEEFKKDGDDFPRKKE